MNRHEEDRLVIACLLLLLLMALVALALVIGWPALVAVLDGTPEYCNVLPHERTQDVIA